MADSKSANKQAVHFCVNCRKLFSGHWACLYQYAPLYTKKQIDLIGAEPCHLCSLILGRCDRITGGNRRLGALDAVNVQVLDAESKTASAAWNVCLELQFRNQSAQRRYSIELQMIPSPCKCPGPVFERYGVLLLNDGAKTVSKQQFTSRRGTQTRRVLSPSQPRSCVSAGAITRSALVGSLRAVDGTRLDCYRSGLLAPRETPSTCRTAKCHVPRRTLRSVIAGEDCSQPHLPPKRSQGCGKVYQPENYLKPSAMP
jgi:hypothetical protein